MRVDFDSLVEILVMPELMLDPLDTAEFGDKRLTKRFVAVMERLLEMPNMSIPAAMNGRAEMEAAYRFCDNSKVSPDSIRAPHVLATHERIRQTDVVVLVQDTTELDLTRPHQQVDGAGPLDSKSRVGGFYHPLMAFDLNGVPLGEVWKKDWVRETIETNLSRDEKRQKRKDTPIEDKESVRWLEGVRAAREVARVCPQTQCVCVADSEADVYELFAEPRDSGEGQDLHLLVRACQDRRVGHHGDRLLETVRETPCLAECMLDVSSRQPKSTVNNKRHQPRDARMATVEIRATTVTFRPPSRPDRMLPEVTLNVVLVEEPHPPEGQQPIQWILVTTLPINDIEQIQRIVKYYGLRWQIEVYFKTLKSGCRIESRYFERMGRLQNCLAMYTIVAWKILYLCRLSKQCPDLDCEVVFEPCEWKPVYMTVRRKEPPSSPPTLNEMVRMIASLGGYVMRAKTQPGTQTLWLGLQRLHDLSTAWNAFGPGVQRR